MTSMLDKFILSLATKLLILLFLHASDAQNCLNTEFPKIYLDAALKMLQMAKESYPSEYTGQMTRPADCYDLLNVGYNKSGIYTIWPRNRVIEDRSIEVYCDMDTDGGGWTVIQRRGNFQRPEDFFFKDWLCYKKGFGDLDKDFWLGNDYIFAISNQKQYSARIDLKAVDGEVKYAHYDYFWIDDENHKYMLHINDYSGDAGDSLYPKHNKQMFSTKDQKNDNRKEPVGCAVSFKGGWWYNECHDSNLNGLYLRGKHESHANGVNWKTWRGHKESLEETEIKLRPKDSKRSQLAQTPKR